MGAGLSRGSAPFFHPLALPPPPSPPLLLRAAYNVMQARWAERLDQALLASRMRHTSVSAGGPYVAPGPGGARAGSTSAALALPLKAPQEDVEEVGAEDVQEVLLPVDKLLMEVRGMRAWVCRAGYSSCVCMCASCVLYVCWWWR